MEQFPELENDQVAVLRAEVSTGHVFDESYHLVMNDAQKVFTTFDNVAEALNFIGQEIRKSKQFEFVIYGKRKCLIDYITP